MDQSHVREALDGAYEAANGAATLRRRLRWKQKPGSRRREKQIADALEEIRRAMAPIRSLIGKAAWEEIPQEPDLRAVSRRLQYERRQLKKMRRP